MAPNIDSFPKLDTHKHEKQPSVIRNRFVAYNGNWEQLEQGCSVRSAGWGGLCCYQLKIDWLSGRTSLGEDLYRILTVKSTSAKEMFSSLNLTSETNALEVFNRLHGAILAWKETAGQIKFMVGLPKGILNIISGFDTTAGAPLWSHMDMDKCQREKKMENEKDEYTLDGTVDKHGQPVVHARTGRWFASVLLLATNEMIEYLRSETNILREQVDELRSEMASVRECDAENRIDNKKVKDKHKSTGGKKPPKPPRGLSSDAADQKLIKEIIELAMIKLSLPLRGRGKVRVYLTFPDPTTLGILSDIHQIAAGMSSGSSVVSSHDSTQPSGSRSNSFIIQQYYNLSARTAAKRVGYPNLVEKVSGSDPRDGPKRVTA
ncbi:hypothetical protein T459_19254 [Capsicum annuum]|uniref:PRONE domain-containing protein n=1 Tax=Capsicum annuum TaxID=4072 RepID=A0A2G2Z137_CAPAN|nr:hypothetical protein T459_19254 [Capsicum annuum]